MRAIFIPPTKKPQANGLRGLRRSRRKNRPAFRPAGIPFCLAAKWMDAPQSVACEFPLVADWSQAEVGYAFDYLHCNPDVKISL